MLNIICPSVNRCLFTFVKGMMDKRHEALQASKNALALLGGTETAFQQVDASEKAVARRVRGHTVISATI